MTTNRDTSPSAHRRAAAAGPQRPAVAAASPHRAALLELLNSTPRRDWLGVLASPGSPCEGVERPVPLTPAVAAAVREHLAGRRLAFSEERPPSPLDTCWPDRLRRNGFAVTHRAPHELRRRPDRTPDRGQRGRTTSATGVSST